jgi:broad specificity phosphatase PhoE
VAPSYESGDSEPARLILVRHGPSSLHTRGLFDHDGVVRWQEAYDVAGIKAVVHPPAVLLQMAAGATHILASDLRRAVESAEVLAPGREIQLSDTLREIHLPVPRWPLRAPLGVWATLMYVRWRYRVARGKEPSVEQRARVVAAADLLEGIVANGSTAFVVTHDFFRQRLERQLLDRGWVSSGRTGGYLNWSFWMLSPPDVGPPT